MTISRAPYAFAGASFPFQPVKFDLFGDTHLQTSAARVGSGMQRTQALIVFGNQHAFKGSAWLVLSTVTAGREHLKMAPD